MARTGRFGTLPSAAPNLTATIVSLMEAYQGGRDRNIMSAWQSGGQFEGKKVTDERLLTWFRKRRDQYERADPEWDYWDQQIQQTDYDVGESKMLLSLAQGNTSYGGAARWYTGNASRFPRNSEAWRAAMRAAAQYRKAAQESKAAGHELSESERYNNQVERVERNVVAPATKALGLFEEMLAGAGVMTERSEMGLPGLNTSAMDIGNDQLRTYLETSRRGQRYADQWRRLTGEEFTLSSVRRMMRRGKAGTTQQAAIAKRFGYQSYVGQHKARGKEFQMQAIAIEMFRRDVLDPYDEAKEAMQEVLMDKTSSTQERIEAREMFASVLDQIAKRSASVGDTGMEGRARNEALMYRGLPFTSVPTVGSERGAQTSGSGFSVATQEHPVWARDAQGNDIVGTPDTQIYGEADYAGALARGDLFVDEGLRDGTLLNLWDETSESYRVVGRDTFPGGKGPDALEYATLGYYGAGLTVLGADGKPEQRAPYQSLTAYKKRPMVWQIGANGLQSGNRTWQFANPVSTWTVGGTVMYEYTDKATGLLISSPVPNFMGVGDMVPYAAGERMLQAITSVELDPKTGQMVATYNPDFDWGTGTTALYDAEDPEAWAKTQADIIASKTALPARESTYLPEQPIPTAGLRPGQRADETNEEYFARRRGEWETQRETFPQMAGDLNVSPAALREEGYPVEPEFTDWLARKESTDETVPGPAATAGPVEPDETTMAGLRASGLIRDVPFDQLSESELSLVRESMSTAGGPLREVTAPPEPPPAVEGVAPGEPGVPGVQAAAGTGVALTMAEPPFDPQQFAPAVLSPMLYSNDSELASFMSSDEMRKQFMSIDPAEFLQRRIEANGWQDSPQQQMYLSRDIDNLRYATPRARTVLDYYQTHPESASRQVAEQVNKATVLRAMGQSTSMASLVTGAKYGFGGRRPMREWLLSTGKTDAEIDQQFPELREPTPDAAGTRRMYDPTTGKLSVQNIAASELERADEFDNGSVLPRVRSAIQSDVRLRGDAALPNPDLMAPGGASVWVHDAIRRGREAFEPPKTITAPVAPNVMQPSVLGPGRPAAPSIRPPKLMPIRNPSPASIAYDPLSSIRTPATSRLPTPTETSNVRRESSGTYGRYSGGWYK